MSDPDYIIDIKGLGDSDLGGPAASRLIGRPWVGVRFDCCGVYNRVYRNSEGTAYLGHCPRCLKKIRLSVGPDGVASRFFTAE